MLTSVGLVAFIMMSAVEVSAADKLWIGGDSGAWATATNWDGGAVPTTSDKAIFQNDAVVTIVSGDCAGTLYVERGVTLTLESTEPTISTAVTGYGTIVKTAKPSTSFAAKLKATAWCGTLLLDGIALGQFSPDDYGNVNSVVGFRNCSGYLPASLTSVSTTLEMQAGDDGAAAFTCTKGYSGVTVQLSALSGNGKLTVAATEKLAEPYVLIINEFSDFAGSIKLTDGDIDLEDDAYHVINEGECWQTGEGEIQLGEFSKLAILGSIGSPVRGDGSVYYLGDIGSEDVNEIPQLTASTWRGMVIFRSAILDCPSLVQAGNSASRLRFQASRGSIASQYLKFPVELTGLGLTITDVKNNNVVRFSKLEGDGKFTLSEGTDDGDLEQFLVDDISEFTGTLLADSNDKAFGLGDATCLSGGEISYGDGVVVPRGDKWYARTSSFSDTLYVTNAVDGDDFLYVVGDPGEYDAVVIHLLTDGEDAEQHHSLIFDSDRDMLYLALRASPPTAEVKLLVETGVDLTNVVLKLEVNKFSMGVDYTGGFYAQVLVRDADGNAVKIYGVTLTQNEVITLGELALPGNSADDFYYDVDVIARRTSFDNDEIIDDADEINPISHLQAEGWVLENAEMYQLPEDDPQRTGKWTSEGSTVSLAEDKGSIAIDNGYEIENRAEFEAKTEPEEEIVRFDLSFTLEDGGAVMDIVSGSCAQIAIVADDTDENSCKLQVLDPEQNEMVSVTGAKFGWVEGATHKLNLLMNFTSGTLAYRLDGTLLKTEDGKAAFALTPEMRELGHRAKSVVFTGKTHVNVIEGDLYSGDIAETVTEAGSVTNRYETLDGAIASMAGESGTVKLLWNATWHPTIGEVGGSYTVDLNGHEMLIDTATTNQLREAGYWIVDDGSGTYRVEPIRYTLTLASNDLEGGDDSATVEQFYTVTNRQFALTPIKDCFENEGNDFVCWNMQRDGSGATNYVDGAVIDVTGYGLGDMALYAQWKPKERAIRIEATDPDVYIELVTTNDAENTGVRYFKPGDTEETKYQALIPVENGCSNLIIRFSTDIGKRLSSYYLKKHGKVTGDEEVLKEFLPTNLVADAQGNYSTPDPTTTWAASHFITKAELALSPYARSSSKLSMNSLLTEKSQVEISEFELDDDSCTFKVTVDGEPLTDASGLSGMVMNSTDLKEWKPATIESVDAEGRVKVVTDAPGAFVKIVIPQD